MSKDLTLRDLEVFQSQEVLGETGQQTAEKLSVSRKTIINTKNKQGYRELCLAAMEKKGVTADTFAERLKYNLFATRKRMLKGEVVDVDDNAKQIAAFNRLGDIFGVDAPKEFDLKHSMAAMGDGELRSALNDSVREFNESVQHKTAMPPDEGATYVYSEDEQESPVADGE